VLWSVVDRQGAACPSSVRICTWSRLVPPEPSVSWESWHLPPWGQCSCFRRWCGSSLLVYIDPFVPCLQTQVTGIATIVLDTGTPAPGTGGLGMTLSMTYTGRKTLLTSTGWYNMHKDEGGCTKLSCALAYPPSGLWR
jgi:hypothetical protein